MWTNPYNLSVEPALESIKCLSRAFVMAGCTDRSMRGPAFTERAMLNNGLSSALPKPSIHFLVRSCADGDDDDDDAPLVEKKTRSMDGMQEGMGMGAMMMLQDAEGAGGGGAGAWSHLRNADGGAQQGGRGGGNYGDADAGSEFDD